MDDKTQPHFRSSDDVDTTFAEAVVHVPGHKVLGFRLRPFSFWHAANLDFIESPFAGHRKALDFPALYIAARTCQFRYPATFRQRRFEWLVELWKARKYRAIILPRRTRSSTKNSKGSGKSKSSLRVLRGENIQFPFLRELNKFSAYIRDYVSRPEYVASDDSTPVKSPWYLYEVCLLKRHNPDFTWGQCWDTPIGWAAWHNAGMLEAGGSKIEILTPEMRKAIKQVEELQSTVAAAVSAADR